MRVLCSMPGRFGDIAWSLPTVRAISETYGVSVDLLIAGEFSSLIPLLELQPYLDRVHADPAWSLSHGWQPPGREDVISPYDKVHHLGYRRWPELPLPVEIFQTSLGEHEWVSPLDLSRPWITVEEDPHHTIVSGWSDCWFELKVGLLTLLQKYWHVETSVCIPAGSRWATEGYVTPSTWLEAARIIAAGQVFLGDCSALHVLAVALGKPCVIYEPMQARLNDIFWPLGKDGPQVTLVRGLDGEMTTDSRHTAETLERVLAGVSHAK